MQNSSSCQSISRTISRTKHSDIKFLRRFFLCVEGNNQCVIIQDKMSIVVPFSKFIMIKKLFNLFVSYTLLKSLFLLHLPLKTKLYRKFKCRGKSNNTLRVILQSIQTILVNNICQINLHIQMIYR